MKIFTFATVCLAVSLAGVLNGNEPVIKTSVSAVEPVPLARIPHCEVPCGIYADELRFQQMLEDTATITKAIKSISAFTDGLEDNPPTAKGFNQATRWVTTKENHATNTQHIVSQYFLTQRIKQDHKDYTGQLATAHRVLVAAMKCKQDSDPATAEALKSAIYDLYRAYEGKEPAFEREE